MSMPGSIKGSFPVEQTNVSEAQAMQKEEEKVLKIASLSGVGASAVRSSIVHNALCKIARAQTRGDVPDLRAEELLYKQWVDQKFGLPKRKKGDELEDSWYLDQNLKDCVVGVKKISETIKTDNGEDETIALWRYDNESEKWDRASYELTAYPEDCVTFLKTKGVEIADTPPAATRSFYTHYTP